MHPRTGFKFTSLADLEKGFERRVLITNDTLPVNFVYNPNMITRNLNQGICGSCWAFAIAGVMSDMISIKTEGNVRVNLSAQQIVECVPPFPGTANGCDGNDVNMALHYLPTDGIVAEAEYPYRQKNSLTVVNTTCPTFPDTSFKVRVKPSQTYIISSNISYNDTINSMKTHIYHKGPIIGALLWVYPDLYDYDGISVYEPKPNQPNLGGHAVEIVGWGTNPQGISYWICQHDWGDEFAPNHLQGMGKGWMYIRMGVNASGIEEIAYAIDDVELVNPNVAVQNSESALRMDTNSNDTQFTHPVWVNPSGSTIPTSSNSVDGFVTPLIVGIIIGMVLLSILIPKNACTGSYSRDRNGNKQKSNSFITFDF